MDRGTVVMNAEERVAHAWRGVAIEEGFEDRSLFDHLHVVATQAERLEGEDEQGEFHFHKVEVADPQLHAAMEAAKRTLRPSWYFHLVREGKMVVLFRGKAFEVAQGDALQLQMVKEYGLAQGIHEDQLCLERLFLSPYDE
jgi:hypothetical protein